MALFGAWPAHASNADFATRVLDRHNLARRVVGSAPLSWDAALAASADSWARHLAATRQFEHATDDETDDPQGENLWMGTANAYSYEEMVDGWIEERRFYRAGLFPKVTTTAAWTDVGHYTQLIWHSTLRVGCALANGGGNDVLVCRYSPAGNWENESPTRSTLALNDIRTRP